VTDGRRPRIGWVDHRDGARTEVRFVATADPKVFLAVTVDGAPILLDPYGDKLHFDMLGAGQTVTVSVKLP